mgnify:CR=1 FL=1
MFKRYFAFRFISLLALCSTILPACTYDYFDDESNYVVYVPKADAEKVIDSYSIEDLAIYIYSEDLQRERYSFSPFEEDARAVIGNYHFKLFPGFHSVYSFTGLSNLTFTDLNTQSTARFDLQKNTDGYYLEPSAIFLEYATPTILFPGPVVTDTAHFERPFTGRICIAFKNMSSLHSSLTANDISKVEIEATGIGTTQYFSQITDSVSTRSSRFSSEDKMLLSSVVYENPYEDFEFGLENHYLPSPALGTKEYISLQLRFINNQNMEVYSMFVDLADETRNPIILHTNETIVIKIDGDKIHIISLDNPADWESIMGGGSSGPGSGVEV